MYSAFFKVCDRCPDTLLYVHFRFPFQDARRFTAIEVSQVDITRAPGCLYDLWLVADLRCQQCVYLVDRGTFAGGDTKNIIVTMPLFHGNEIGTRDISHVNVVLLLL